MLLLFSNPPAAAPVTYATDTWTGANGSAWGAQWTPVHAAGTGSETIQSNAGRMTTGGAVSYATEREYLSGMSAVTDTELTATFTVGVQDESYLAFTINGNNSTWSTDNSYTTTGYVAYLTISPTAASSTLALIKMLGGTQSQPGATVPISISAGTAYNIRFQRIGSNLRVRIWQVYSTEPSSWNISTTDPGTLLGAGNVSLALQSGSTASARTVTFDDLAVTNGIPGPRYYAGSGLANEPFTDANGTTFASHNSSYWGTPVGPVTATIQGNKGYVATTNSTQNAYGYAPMSGVTTSGSFDLTGTVGMLDSNVFQYAIFGVGSGTDLGNGPQNSLFLQLTYSSTPGNSAISLYSSNGSTLTQLAIVNPYTLNGGTAYSYRIRFNSATSTFTARLWTGAEPGTWDLTASTTGYTPPAAGYPWFVSNNGAGGAAPYGPRTMVLDDIVFNNQAAAVVPGPAFTGSGSLTIPAGVTGYSAFRWTINSVVNPSSGTQASEFQLLNGSGARITGAAVTNANNTGSPSTEQDYNLNDGDVSTKWYTGGTNSGAQIIYTYGTPQSPVNYTWYTANDTPDRDPSSWTLEGSNDGGSTWTTLDTRTGFTPTTTRMAQAGVWPVALGSPNPYPSISSAAALTGSGSLTTIGTASQTASGTATLSGTGTLVASGAPSLTGTTAFSGSGTLSGIGTATQNASGTASFSGSGTLAANGLISVTRSAAFSGSGTLASSAVPTIQSSAAFSASGTLVGNGSLNFSQNAPLSGSGTLTTAPTPTLSGTSAFSGSGALSTTASPSLSGASAFTGSGTLAGVGSGVQYASGTAPFTGSGALSAVSNPTLPGTGNATGSGTLSQSGTPTLYSSANYSGSGTLSSVGKPTFTGTANTTGSGSLTSTAVTGLSGNAGLSGSGALTNSPQSLTFYSSAAYSGTGNLSAVAMPMEFDSAALSGTGSLTVVSMPIYTGTGAFSGSGTLTAQGSPSVARSADFSGSGTLASIGTPTANSTGAFTASGSLSTSGISSIPGSATFTGSGTLVGTGTSTPSGAAGLTGSGTLSAAGSPFVNGATAGFTGSGTLTRATSPSFTRPVAFSGSGTLSRAGAPSFTVLVALSGSGTLAASGSSTYNGIFSSSGSGSLSQSGVPTPSSNANYTGSGTLNAATTSLSIYSTANFSSEGYLNTSSSSSNNGGADFTGAGSLAFNSGTPTVVSSAAFSGSGTLSSTAIVSTSGNAAFTGSGGLSQVGSLIASRSISLSGNGTLAGIGSTSSAGSAAFTGSGALSTINSSPSVTSSASFTGNGNLVASGKTSILTAAQFSGAGVLSTTGIPLVSQAIYLTGTGALSAQGQNVSFSESAEFAAEGSLSIIASESFTEAVFFSAVGALFTSTSTGKSGSISFSAMGTLVAAGVASFAVPVALSGAGVLVAQSGGQYFGSHRINKAFLNGQSITAFYYNGTKFVI